MTNDKPKSMDLDELVEWIDKQADNAFQTNPFNPQERMAFEKVSNYIDEHRDALTAGLQKPGVLRFVITHEGKEWIAYPQTPSGVNISCRASATKDGLKPWCNEIAKELKLTAEFVEEGPDET